MREGSNSKLALTLLLSLVIITGSYVTVTNYITTDTEQNQVVECSEGEELVEGNCIAEEVHVPSPTDCTSLEVWRNSTCQVMLSPQNLTYGSESYVWTIGDSEILTPSFTGDGPDTWTSIPNLPPYLSLDSKSGIITKSPSESYDVSNHTIVASNSAGVTTTNLSFEVLDYAPAFAYPTNKFTFVLSTFSYGPSPIGDNTNVQQWLVVPNLPDGLSIDNDGIIGGSATSLGNSTHIVTAINSGGSVDFEIDISIIDIVPALWYENGASWYTHIFTKDNEIDPLIANSFEGVITACVSTPELPVGLFLSTNCSISGTPSEITPEANYTIIASNTGGLSSTNLTIIVNDEIISYITYGSNEYVFVKDVDIVNLEPTHNGGSALEWGIEPSLPDGLVFNASNGAIFGISIEETEPANYTIFANNSGGTGTCHLIISSIDITPSNVTYGNTEFIFESNYSNVQINVTNDGYYVDTWESIPSLPLGLTLATDGTITGTPHIRSPQTNYTIFANNSGGTLQVNLTITIHDLEADWLEITSGVSSVDYGGSWPSLILPFSHWSFPVLIDWDDRPIASAGHVGKGKIVGYGHESFVAKSSGDEMKLSLNAMKWACGGIGEIGLWSDFNHFEDELIAEGFVVQTSITPDQLSGLDCFVGEFWNGWTDAQNTNIEQFLIEGGGVILGGHSWYWSYSNSDVAHNYPGNKIAPTTGLFVSTHSGSAQITVDNAPPNRLQRTIPAIVALENHFTTGPLIPTSDAEIVEKTISRSTAMLTLDFNDFWHPLRTMVNTTGWIEIADDNEYDMNADPTYNVLLAIQEGLYLRLPANELDVHPSSADFPGSVPTSASRVTKNITVNGNYIGLPSGFGYAGARSHGMMSTGLYAAPGEMVNVTVPNTIVDQNVRIQIGSHSDSLWGKDTLDRHPKITRIWGIDSMTMQVGNTFGGLIYITFPPDSTFGSIDITIENGVNAPRYIHGVTSEVEWNNTVRNYPAPWAELQGEQFILTVPSSSIRNLDNPVELLDWWDTALQMQHDLSGYLPWTRVERAVFDVQISAGWMHSGYPFMAHLASVPNVVDKDYMATQGDWGMFHELGHNHQWMASTLPGNTETTCNLFSAYIMTELVGIDLGAGHGSMSDANRQSRTESYFNSSAQLSQWSVWTALETHIMIQEEFGWDIYTDTFSHYYNSSLSQPSTDAQEYNSWAARISNETGMNLVPFFRAWGLPINNETYTSVSHLPVWNTDPLRAWVFDYEPILRGLNAANVTSSTSDLEWETYDNGTDVNLTVCWGLIDGGTVKSAWGSCVSIGQASVGFDSYSVDSLMSAQTYYWRVLGEGASGDTWSEVDSFNTS